MSCPGCGRSNPDDARFCGACGAPLEVVCVSCRTASPAGNRFCHRCGGPLAAGPAREPFGSPRHYTPRHLADKILTSADALTGERKQVTVLFVDVSGFTSLSERLDPEEVHGVMNRAFDLMLTEVHRYEGTVNQFLGDGIMALFGAPIAHEDHARRGVLAALGIQRALEGYQRELAPRGITFRARQGLNTGLVVVGSVGGDLRLDYTAVGDTTNVAARLQQASEPGSVTVSDATYRLVQGYVEARALGEIHLKGKTEAVTAWEVVAARESRTRLEVRTERGLTAFVGRARELGTLVDLYESARNGAGQVALVVGEAGIGKSRLLHELRRRIGDEADWHEGHCVSFGRAMTLHPLVDLVRRRFGLDDTDSEAVTVSKLERGVSEIDPDLAPAVPYLRALLSLDPGDVDVRGMNAAQRRGEMFDWLRRLLGRGSARRPQVIVIEDLHWCDSASEQFLTMLVDSVPALRALVVLTYRPGYASPFGERSYVTRMTPAPLSADDSARVAASVLDSDGVPAELRTLVEQKAEGNPFYIEELTKALEETGVLRRMAGRLELTAPVTQLRVPGTIHDLIAARIDRLPEAPKHTLQLAAVIGREFTRRLIDRLSEIRQRTDDLLHELMALELIHERRLYPELAYMFKHALTQDVAYSSLLVHRRRELHRLIGLAVEELYADRLAEHFEVLAHHFSRAEDWARALEYLQKAADKATKAFGLRQALDLLGQAVDAARHLGDAVPAATLMAIYRARADLFLGIGDFAGSHEAATALVGMARRLADREAEAAALMQLASASQWMEDFPAAMEQIRAGIELAEAIGATGAVAAGLFTRSYLHATNGRLDEAGADLGRSLDLARAGGDSARQALALHMLSARKGWQAEYRESLVLGLEGKEIAREHRLVIPLIRCLWNEGLALTELGQYDQAFAALAEGLALAEKIGDDAFIPRFLNTVGWLRIVCGDFAEGIALSQRSYEVTNRSSRAGHATGAERRAFIRINQADAWMAQGDLAAAAEALEEAQHIASHPPPSRWMTWRYTMHGHVSAAELALLRGDPDRARRETDTALAIAEPTRSGKYESWAWRLKGESALHRRAWSEAEEAIGRATAIADRIAQPRQRWLAHLAQGRLHAATGRQDEARVSYRAAAALVHHHREVTRHPALKAGLETWPVLREIDHLAKE